MKYQEKELPQLVKKSSTYRMIVPKDVEEKIRYLIRKFPHTEWSGVLFYTYEGTFEDNNLVITCKDLLPMDVGNSTFTSFKMSEDVASYMAQNIELFECCTGIVHSHHSMAAFFSGTDTNTLRSEGNDTSCFVSLIVNTAGDYCAAVTRKVKKHMKVTIQYLDSSYDFFGEGKKGLSSEDAKENTVDKEYIEYYMLDVEREVTSNPLEYLDERINSIESKKKEAEKSKTIKFNDTLPLHSEWDGWYPKESTEQKTKKNVFPISQESRPADYKKAVKDCVAKMLSCDLSNSSEFFSGDIWVKDHMEENYAEWFQEESSFIDWTDYIVGYCIDYLHSLTKDNKEILTMDIVMDLIEKLDTYTSNDYIESYKAALENYL